MRTERQPVFRTFDGVARPYAPSAYKQHIRFYGFHPHLLKRKNGKKDQALWFPQHPDGECSPGIIDFDEKEKLPPEFSSIENDEECWNAVEAWARRYFQKRWPFRYVILRTDSGKVKVVLVFDRANMRPADLYQAVLAELPQEWWQAVDKSASAQTKVFLSPDSVLRLQEDLEHIRPILPGRPFAPMPSAGDGLEQRELAQASDAPAPPYIASRLHLKPEVQMYLGPLPEGLMKLCSKKSAMEPLLRLLLNIKGSKSRDVIGVSTHALARRIRECTGRKTTAGSVSKLNAKLMREGQLLCVNQFFRPTTPFQQGKAKRYQPLSQFAETRSLLAAERVKKNSSFNPDAQILDGHWYSTAWPAACHFYPVTEDFAHWAATRHGLHDKQDRLLHLSRAWANLARMRSALSTEARKAVESNIRKMIETIWKGVA